MSSHILINIVNVTRLSAVDNPFEGFGELIFEINSDIITVDLQADFGYGYSAYLALLDSINSEISLSPNLQNTQAYLDFPQHVFYATAGDDYNPGDLAGSYSPISIVSSDGNFNNAEIILSDISSPAHEFYHTLLIENDPELIEPTVIENSLTVILNVGVINNDTPLILNNIIETETTKNGEVILHISMA